MKNFRLYNPDQILLLPPSIQDWLPENHLSRFILEVVDMLDLSAILRVYERGDGRGQPPYHPAMMVALLLYGYCIGVFSSRKIEDATYTDVAFRMLAAGQHPDHASIAEFRRRHLKALAELFWQVLQLCARAGLATLGKVAIDGTKLKANASKHKAMSYERMCQIEKRLQEEIDALLKQAEQTDLAEDAKYGSGRTGTDLPEEMKRRETRLAKIREAKAALEEEAKERARQKAETARAEIEKRRQEEEETGKKPKGQDPKIPDPEQARPDPKAQRNFTDPDSRIMRDGATKAFEQAYNAQAAVDKDNQIIVAALVTNEANDKQQLIPVLQAVEENTGRRPTAALADAGYFSDTAVKDDAAKGVDLYVAVGRQKHGEQTELAEGEAPEDATQKEKMGHKFRTAEGKATYGLRKTIVEPVFGQIKGARRIRTFSFRGQEKVGQEWDLICLTHNLLKLFVSKVGKVRRVADASKRSRMTAPAASSQGVLALNAA
jgi:transposase